MASVTAVNRDGALCCPDFPRDRGLKPRLFFPYPAMNRHAMSGIRESNPPPRLGKPMHYRCANAANNFRCKGSKNIARMQIFCLKVQKKTTISRLFWVTSGARTHDTRNHNPMLCQLSYSHHIGSLSKPGAKVLLFFDMTKYFTKKMSRFLLLLIF